MGIEEILADKRVEILRIAARHGAYNVRVFGSVARGEAGPESDVDFLVDAAPGVSPWFPAGLIGDLQDLLGRPVDVAQPKLLHRVIKDEVMSEAVPL